jgi:hypothetical protein
MEIGFSYSKKDVEETAQEIYTEIYMTLFDSDSDKGEECLVSILSQKLAIKTVDRIILANPHSNPLNTQGWSTMRFWQDVKKRLEKILNIPES